MNKAFTILILLTVLTVNSLSQVGIGTTAPDSSALLEVSAVRKGILIPRIASAARAAIASPATGLLVFQTDGTAGFYYYNGITWVNLASGLTPDTSGYANSSYGLVSTFAGSGSRGSADATGAAASFYYPNGVAVDGSGNVYVADYYNYKIRKITQAGVVTTFAGSGSFGSTDATGTAASFSNPNGVAVDGSGNVYVADNFNNKIRKITPAGVVTTFAGNGSKGSADGTGTTASFNNPTGVTVDASGNVYVADEFNYTIRKITSAGVVTTFAGNGSLGSTDATGAAASFNFPIGVAVDAGGNVYVADVGNNEIRKITPAGVVTTLAGNGSPGSIDATGAAAGFNNPKGVAVDAGGNVYVADYSNNKIRKIITTANFVTNTSLSTALNNYVSVSTDQTVNGTKTFSSNLIVNGNVGIGTTSPDQLLTVNGNASKPGGGSWATFSDSRLKKNIQDYNKGLREILAIHPVRFQYNKLSGYADQSKTYIGIVAQEMQKILPSTISSVNTDKQVKDKLQYDGSELTYTLINAIKEQQAEIKKLKQENKNQKIASELNRQAFVKRI